MLKLSAARFILLAGDCSAPSVFRLAAWCCAGTQGSSESEWEASEGERERACKGVCVRVCVETVDEARCRLRANTSQLRLML